MAGTIPGWKPEAVVAVAPFQAWGSECLGPWFGSAVARHLTRALGQLPGIHVISFDSMMGYTPRAATHQIGIDVGTRYLVRGQIVGLGADSLEYRARLLDTRSNGTMTRVRALATFASCMDLQGEIIPQLLYPLEKAIRSAELMRVVLPTTRRMLALERVENAIGAILSLDRGRFDLARGWLEQATRLDPGFALAWAWLARWHSLRIGQGWATDRGTEARMALEKARRAIDLDPRNPLALATLGHINAYLLKDSRSARRQFRKALAADQNHALTWALSGLTYCYLGKAVEASQRIETAMRLSPRDPMKFYFHLIAGHVSWLTKDYHSAEKHCRASLAINDRFTATHRLVAAALVGQGRASEAEEVGRLHGELDPSYYHDRQVDPPFVGSEPKKRLLEQWQAANILARAR